MLRYIHRYENICSLILNHILSNHLYKLYFEHNKLSINVKINLLLSFLSRCCMGIGGGCRGIGGGCRGVTASIGGTPIGAIPTPFQVGKRLLFCSTKDVTQITYPNHNVNHLKFYIKQIKRNCFQSNCI